MLSANIKTCVKKRWLLCVNAAFKSFLGWSTKTTWVSVRERWFGLKLLLCQRSSSFQQHGSGQSGWWLWEMKRVDVRWHFVDPLWPPPCAGNIRSLHFLLFLPTVRITAAPRHFNVICLRGNSPQTPPTITGSSAAGRFASAALNSFIRSRQNNE